MEKIEDIEDVEPTESPEVEPYVAPSLEDLSTEEADNLYREIAR